MSNKRAREEEEDGEITNTQILDELSVLKEEVEFLREEKAILARQYADAAEMRDKYKARLSRRKEGAKKWKEDLEEEGLEALRADYAELRYELESKKDKWKSERNKWGDRVERLEVKIEALKEENHKLVVMETRLRGDFERRILSSTSEQRYKDQIKQLEESLKHREVAFRAADALQREQEAATETMKANVKHIDDIMRLKDDKITALQQAASRAAQQLADASNALDHAAHQKSALEKNLQAANVKFHEQIKVDAHKITALTNELSDKTRQLAEQKNITIHTAAKVLVLESSEKELHDEIARLNDINNKLAYADEQARLLQADNQSLSQQLAFRNAGPDVMLASIENLKMQNFNLTAEIGRMRAFAQDYEMERGQLLEEIQVLRHGKGMGPRNGMARGTFANMQLRLAQLGNALGLVGPPGGMGQMGGPGMGHNNGPNGHGHNGPHGQNVPNGPNNMHMGQQGVPSPPNPAHMNNPAQMNMNNNGGALTPTPLSPSSGPQGIDPNEQPMDIGSPSDQNLIPKPYLQTLPPQSHTIISPSNNNETKELSQQESSIVDGAG